MKIDATTAIAEYSPTEAKLAELRTKHKDVVYPVATPHGMRDALQARAEIRTVRTGLEKERVRIKGPALERCRMIDAEAKRITAELLELETPIDQQVKAQEVVKEAERQAKAEAERKRVEYIQIKIDWFRNVAVRAAECSSVRLAEDLELLSGKVIAEDEYQEFTEAALEAWNAAIGTLKSLYESTLAQEQERAKIEAERAELARLREEQRKRDEEAERAMADAKAKAKAEREAEEARLRATREAEETKARAAREEEDRRLAEVRAKEERTLAIERARIEEERRKLEAEKRAEQERLIAQARAEREEANRKQREAEAAQAEAKRQQEEAERQQAERERAERAHQEHMEALRKARRETPKKALADILALAEDEENNPDDLMTRRAIALIARATLIKDIK